MRVALVYALLALIPLVAGWRRARRRWLLLASPLIMLGALGALGVGLTRAGFGVPPFAPFHPTRAAMGLLGLAAYAGLVWLPPAYLAIALRLAQRGSRSLAAGIALACALTLGLALWALLLEPSTLRVRTETIRSERAPPRPLRILHLSDLQTDGPCARERRAAREVERSDVDLAIFTGDLANDLYLDDRDEKIAAVNALFRAIHARHGAFLVRGDWDGWDDDWASMEKAMLEGTQVKVLANTSVRLSIDGADVVIYGMDGGPHADPRVADLRDEPALRIVAMHHPDHAVDVPKGGADLVLAGHTHGGQVVLPVVGALITHSERGFVGGRYDVGGTPLVISRGIGMRGGPAPRARLGCPPEIGVVTVARP